MTRKKHSVILCSGLLLLLSSPVTYRSSPAGTADLIAVFAALDEESVTPAAELARDQQYMILVTRAQSAGQATWGADLYSP